MILGNQSEQAVTAEPVHWPTLDDLFRSAAARRGDAIALADPQNRLDFTDGAPRRLTYAEADRVVGAIAARLLNFGFPADSVIALQMPNTVESVLTLLGVLRAGLIAAPIPLLWRRAEAVEALGRVRARGLITCRRIGPTNHAEIAMNVAADLFPMRFVGAFGRNPPDGVEALDEVFTSSAAATDLAHRAGEPSDHVAAVTFDVTEDGLVPVARSHAELLAGGLAVALAGRIRPEAHIIGTVLTSSFAALASTVLPWLIGGGTLTLHHPFDPGLLAGQCAASDCSAVVLPGPVLARFAEAGLIGAERGPAAIAVWRAPERRAASGIWPGKSDVVDVLAFGEMGVVPLRRTSHAVPAPLIEQTIRLPIAQEHEPVLIEVARIAGSLALSGAMVPRHAFPAGAEIGPSVGPTGFVDTGYVCRADPDGAITFEGPPSGLINVGGYRFRLRELNDVCPEMDSDGMLAILPDSLAGYRLAGVASSRDALRQALIEHGSNALILSAFGERRSERASAA